MFDILRWRLGGRKPDEAVNPRNVYCFGTGSACELLDIGVIRYRVLLGFCCLGGTQCHVNSLLYS